jgi:hypothetical protein
VLDKANHIQQASDEIDVNWLKEAVLTTLEKNRVTKPAPTKRNPFRKLSYHAPSLKPLTYPHKWPSWLKWMYKLWWKIKEPIDVRYPHQWNWDSCAHVVSMTHFDLDLAREEMELLLRGQREDGFIPHMIWNPHRMHWGDILLKKVLPIRYGSPYLQPPAMAATVERIAVEYVYQGTDDLDFLKWALPRLKKYYLYIHNHRVTGNDHLPEIFISYESKDRSPEYDPVYGHSNAGLAPIGPMARLIVRYASIGWDHKKIIDSNLFRVKDTLFCCVYAQNLRSLSRLCDISGDDQDCARFTQMADQVESSILDKMYDPDTGLYFSLDARHGKDKQIKVNTISSLMPLILENIDKKHADKLVNDWLLNPNEFWAKYPVPVEPVSSPFHNMHVIWRGHQTWIYTNWYLAKGLRLHGYNDVADELTRRTYKLIKNQGFREYYSAKTGKGERATDYGWTTLIMDMVADM